MSLGGVRPLISQEAKTHKPQECPEPCIEHTEGGERNNQFYYIIINTYAQDL